MWLASRGKEVINLEEFNKTIDLSKAPGGGSCYRFPLFLWDLINSIHTYTKNHISLPHKPINTRIIVLEHLTVRLVSISEINKVAEPKGKLLLCNISVQNHGMKVSLSYPLHLFHRDSSKTEKGKIPDTTVKRLECLWMEGTQHRLEKKKTIDFLETKKLTKGPLTFALS